MPPPSSASTSQGAPHSLGTAVLTYLDEVYLVYSCKITLHSLNNKCTNVYINILKISEMCYFNKYCL